MITLYLFKEQEINMFRQYQNYRRIQNTQLHIYYDACYIALKLYTMPVKFEKKN